MYYILFIYSKVDRGNWQRSEFSCQTSRPFRFSYIFTYVLTCFFESKSILIFIYLHRRWNIEFGHLIQSIIEPPFHYAPLQLFDGHFLKNLDLQRPKCWSLITSPCAWFLELCNFMRSSSIYFVEFFFHIHGQINQSRCVRPPHSVARSTARLFYIQDYVIVFFFFKDNSPTVIQDAKRHALYKISAFWPRGGNKCNSTPRPLVHNTQILLRQRRRGRVSSNPRRVSFSRTNTIFYVSFSLSLRWNRIFSVRKLNNCRRRMKNENSLWHLTGQRRVSFSSSFSRKKSSFFRFCACMWKFLIRKKRSDVHTEALFTIFFQPPHISSTFP